MPPRESDEEDSGESGDEGVAKAAMAGGGDEFDEATMAGGGGELDEADDGDEPDDGFDDHSVFMELASYKTLLVTETTLAMWKRTVAAVCRAFEEAGTFPQSFEDKKVTLARYSYDGSLRCIA